VKAQEQHQDGLPDPGEPVSPQTAADEGETTEQSVWSSYAQAHHVMIEVGMPEAATYDARYTRGVGDVSTRSGSLSQAEQQDSRDWSEAEAVLANSFALNAIDGLGPDKGAVNPQRETSSSDGKLG
jgi:hypothetical protein